MVGLKQSTNIESMSEVVLLFTVPLKSITMLPQVDENWDRVRLRCTLNEVT